MSFYSDLLDIKKIDDNSLLHSSIIVCIIIEASESACFESGQGSQIGNYYSLSLSFSHLQNVHWALPLTRTLPPSLQNWALPLTRTLSPSLPPKLSTLPLTRTLSLLSFKSTSIKNFFFPKQNYSWYNNINTYYRINTSLSCMYTWNMKSYPSV